jgi:hypothetical protein
MEQEQTTDPHFQKGFNEGYIVTKHLPELSQDLAEVKSEAPRMEGFREGRRQFILEKVQERSPAYVQEGNNSQSNPYKTKNNSKDRDKDMER